MGFEIVADEAIDTAYIASSDDDDLKQCLKNWNELIDTAGLTCYVIKTISTNSEIKIIAKRFKLMNAG